MADKKKKNIEEAADGKKLAALEARIEGLNEQLEEAREATQEAEKKVEEAEKKAADAKADYLRLMAEFDTFRRRTAEEKLALVSSASADTIKG
ncbi:MAG: nucleotide exchange factor GrpE, partial [Bacteroidales bacterium]|nr:nucleotide exchange factor GrpE [Bacteroidales bacterium]